jgi:signal transduction histidine kinase
VISAATLAEFAAPFETAARRGITLLIVVGLLATLAAALLTSRMTRSLSELADAADAIRGGDLTVRVPANPRDEVGRVAQAFNGMTESLRRTLAELSQREALARVGSFAAELAHEVRNPLTSIKLDLQQVEERLPKEGELRQLQRGALEELARLDRTVAGVLQIARSGRITLTSVDVRDPLRAAVHAVEPLIRQAGATLTVDVQESPLLLTGDASALQQLFTNLLINCVQASERGGSIHVHASSGADGAQVIIRDTGSGISSEQLSRVREPFYSTRPEGTGLGLAIADRIASAHRAEIRIESRPGQGTSVTVRFGTERTSRSDAVG